MMRPCHNSKGGNRSERRRVKEADSNHSKDNARRRYHLMDDGRTKTEGANVSLCAVATVVKTSGSAYRRPGARMLVYADGRREGSISGGCLEADVAERALKTLTTGEPVCVMYDTSGANGDVFFETGCNGAIGILIEPIRSASVKCYLNQIAQWRCDRRVGVVATIYRATAASGAALGERLLLHQSGVMDSHIGDVSLCESLRIEAQAVLETPQAGNRTVTLRNGEVEVLLEKFYPALRLLICGAGQDAIPLAQCAAQMQWEVYVTDHREAFLTAERFPRLAGHFLTRPEDWQDASWPDSRTVAMIMTHHAGHDREYLRLLLPSEAAYIGLLGPKRRGERLLDELRAEGFCPTPEHLARLRSPAGLDIGAETPEEIAIALIAEIQAALNKRPGSALRERSGPIHVPLEPASNAAETLSSTEIVEGFSCPL